MKLALLVSLATGIALHLTSCGKTPVQVLQDKRKGELTRELAAELLNDQMGNVAISRLAFNRTGIENAIQDGMIEKAGGLWPAIFYRLSPSGTQSLSGVVSSIQSDPSGVWIALKKPIHERVREVTGIAAAPMQGFSSVEYVTVYEFPQDFQALTKYVFSGRKAEAVFRKYDDGWRVAN